MRVVDADQATLATLELNTTLQVQAASLQGDETSGLAMVMSSEEVKTNTSFLVDALNETLANQSSAVTEIPAYEKIMARLEINTTRAYELLDSYKSIIDPEIQTDITRRLEDIGRGIVLVNERRVSDESLAQQELLDLLQRSKKLIVFITEISATDKTVLEKLVPKVLTPEEEQLQKIDWITELDKNLAIMNQSKASTSADLTEKINYTTNLVEENKTKAIATSDFAEIKPLLVESIQLTKDILLAIESEGISISIVVEEPVVPELPVDTASTTDEFSTSTEEQI
jgi:hypothetical protein